MHDRYRLFARSVVTPNDKGNGQFPSSTKILYGNGKLGITDVKIAASDIIVSKHHPVTGADHPSECGRSG